MGKEVTSVSLDPEDKAWFKDTFPEVSLSKLTNQVIKEMRETGKRPDGIRFRREMVEREIETLESRLDQARAQLARLDELEESRSSLDEDAEQKATELANNMTSKVTPENSAIQTQAGKVGVTPEALAELVNEKIEPELPSVASTDGGR